MKQAMHDRTLSLKAKGLLAIIWTDRVGSLIDFDELLESSRDGRDATRAAARELEAAGYIERRQERGRDGRMISVRYTTAPGAR